MSNSEIYSEFSIFFVSERAQPKRAPIDTEEINNKDKKTIPDFLIFAISLYYKLISTIIQDKEKDKDV